jgi:spore coat polysaccharide biosynthesis predicted glycosyltransferase SpsG
VPVVLVSMGASDPGGLTVPAVEAVAQARARGARLTARVVANPASPVWKSLPRLLGSLDLPPACAVEPERTVEHLAAADCALLAMGVTVYEAMAAGVPPLVLCRTSGDADHARRLEGQGGCTSLGQHWTVERMAAALADAVAAPERLVAMGRVGRGLVDGLGAERVAARLLGLLGIVERTDAGERAPL